jgi:hypothetical protein
MRLTFEGAAFDSRQGQETCLFSKASEAVRVPTNPLFNEYPGLRSSGTLRSADWYLPTFRDNLSVLSSTVKEFKKIFFDCLTPEDGMLRNVQWLLVTKFRDNLSVSYLRVKQAKEFTLNCFAPEDGTDKLSRNVGKYQSALR